MELDKKKLEEMLILMDNPLINRLANDLIGIFNPDMPITDRFYLYQSLRNQYSLELFELKNKGPRRSAVLQVDLEDSINEIKYGKKD